MTHALDEVFDGLPQWAQTVIVVVVACVVLPPLLFLAIVGWVLGGTCPPAVAPGGRGLGVRGWPMLNRLICRLFGHTKTWTQPGPYPGPNIEFCYRCTASRLLADPPGAWIR